MRVELKNIFLSNPGFICAAGDSENPESFVENLASGNRDGIKKTDCGLVGEGGVKSFFVGKIDDSKLKSTGDAFDMRVLQILDFALSSIKNVVEKAISLYGAERVGVCMGSCDNGSALSFAGHKAFFTEGAFPADYDLKVQGADYPATFTARKFGTRGICLAFSTACSSSASAIVKAKELIRAGICDAVIAGGVDVASDTVLLGFDSLEAIDHEKTNPFSKNRNGINLGEGASVFLLSKDDLDEMGIVLAGSGESSDASHMTAPLADGSGAEKAMKAALEDSGLKPEDVDYVNLHGTGTHLNDSMEGRGVNLVFGSENHLACSSTKPLTGHTLGAAASLELAACFYAIKSQKIPVHVWDGVQDPEIPRLNLVTEKSSLPQKPIRCCMSNSFAFGGCNASLIIRKIK
ncbi:3-oxoacyl-ACP synthase [Treponema ruminis]|uniref:3-oxoacyl-[acyl-carrier-protein] synthase-1 n=1 Tax=Treponema ruminis TaxID=744515 RepID=A0A7W8GAU7_9SPIR|nr:beta-ketoacyl synthase N-terminal-like domain-containing protein [Treponema ruminis]MBB5226945.1 3-oxoacyl-[acyl-carrier-protein] synthase-1 [Treponema ruminis]QSI01372.1 3-oxoacyl-ACP synthase [Treponema ruminis]